MKQPSETQIASLEKLIYNFTNLAKRSPNVAYLLDVTPGDIVRVEALVKKLKEK